MIKSGRFNEASGVRSLPSISGDNMIITKPGNEGMDQLKEVASKFNGSFGKVKGWSRSYIAVGAQFSSNDDFKKAIIHLRKTAPKTKFAFKSTYFDNGYEYTPMDYNVGSMNESTYDGDTVNWNKISAGDVVGWTIEGMGRLPKVGDDFRVGPFIGKCTKVSGSKVYMKVESSSRELNESYESECSEVEYKGSTYLIHEGEIRAIAKGHKHLVYNGTKCLGVGKVIGREDIRNGKEITYELDNGSTISVQYRNDETVSYIYKKLK